jgi:hypothetical protein
MDEKLIGLKNTLVEFIFNINTRIDDISNSINNENRLDDSRLTNLFEDLQALAEGLDVIKSGYSGIDLLELHEKLDMLSKAYEGADYRLLADLLQFELKNLLEYWSEYMSK